MLSGPSENKTGNADACDKIQKSRPRLSALWHAGFVPPGAQQPQPSLDERSRRHMIFQTNPSSVTAGKQ
jgi:hypothetical protein